MTIKATYQGNRKGLKKGKAYTFELDSPISFTIKGERFSYLSLLDFLTNWNNIETYE